MLLVNAYPLAQLLVLILELFQVCQLHLRLTALLLLFVEDVAEEEIVVWARLLADVSDTAGTAWMRLLKRHQVTNLLEPDACSVHGLRRRGYPGLPRAVLNSRHIARVLKR